MKLTKQQRNALKHDANALVVACPGSGKTRTIIARLIRAIDVVRETPRRVACITYTNTAVYEVENRLGAYGRSGDDDYCEVSTIHAFCQYNILRHYHWKLEQFTDGVTVLPSDCDEYRKIVEDLGDEYGLDYFGMQQFESLNRSPDGKPISQLPHEAVVKFWNRLESIGCVDFCSLVYYSYKLLLENPHIVRSLAAKYQFMLIDEIQDTSALQVEILSLIAQCNLTTFFLVGDPEQSIYGFAGAERHLMFSFADEIAATPFHLSGNFRSSTPIIERAESLIPRDPKMFAAGKAKKYNEQPIFQHVANHTVAVTDFFLPALTELNIPFGDAAILAPAWYLLSPLGRFLRNYGVPVVGPGARPYRKSTHVFAGLAECCCAFVDSSKDVSIRQVEKEVFTFLQNVTGNANFRVFDYEGRRTIARILRGAEQLNESNMGAVAWLTAAAREFTEILTEDGFLPITCQSVLVESADEIISDMKRQKDVDIANLTTGDLGMFANPRDNLKLLTMHGAKGREFAAVALIGVHDGRIPYHNKYNQLTQLTLEESRRQMYVAVTRAKRLLALFTDDEDYRPPSRFLSEMGFE